MPISPLERYQEDLKREGFVYDASQQLAIEHLQSLYQRLVENEQRLARTSKVSRWLKGISGRKKQEPEKGLYFWGGVGRGKTYLMDIFYESLPFEQKMRTHFHRFMRRVHHELKELKEQSDPLEIVAEKLAGEARVICFDEFFVSDITDAMILANLLEALFARGTTLVTTSNIVPDGLYKDGLQRARFLPAIALLNKYTEVVNVDGGTDYRLRALEQAELFHYPLDDSSHKALQKCFDSLVPDRNSIKSDTLIEIEGREIRALKEAEDVVWFDFYAVCDGPRSQNDYIEIAREYHAVMVENVPQFKVSNDDVCKRFIYLVDEFYDRGVKLVLTAEVPIIELYLEGRLEFEFQRTVSRIQEMQSREYLCKAHKA